MYFFSVRYFGHGLRHNQLEQSLGQDTQNLKKHLPYFYSQLLTQERLSETRMVSQLDSRSSAPHPLPFLLSVLR